ncbi:MAG: hypothetical protein ACT4QC_13950 [Planctomycetaceae bacterium]
MQSPLLLPEERLLAAAALSPVLSPGFRSRALAAAIEARRRRSFARRTIWVWGMLIVGLSLSTWRGPLALVGEDLRGLSAAVDAAEMSYGSVAPALNVSRRYGRGEFLLSAGSDDWKLVEAELVSRQVGLRCLSTSE